MSEEKWTLDRWYEHVRTNALSSFGLAVCGGALLIAEKPDKKPMELLKHNFNGMSGYQAQAAMELAKVIPIEELRKAEEAEEAEAMKAALNSQVGESG